jgi:hypothetical protein
MTCNYCCEHTNYVCDECIRKNQRKIHFNGVDNFGKLSTTQSLPPLLTERAVVGGTLVEATEIHGHRLVPKTEWNGHQLVRAIERDSIGQPAYRPGFHTQREPIRELTTNLQEQLFPSPHKPLI